MSADNIAIEPSILYWGTPVVLNSTENPNGTFNLAPISSVFWLGWRCMLGFEASSQTAQNLLQALVGRRCRSLGRAGVGTAPGLLGRGYHWSVMPVTRTVMLIRPWTTPQSGGALCGSIFGTP
jgi:hypothetical protein